MDNGKPYTFTLTAEQCSALRVYLSMTSKQREESVSAWEAFRTKRSPTARPATPTPPETLLIFAKSTKSLILSLTKPESCPGFPPGRSVVYSYQRI